MVAREGITDPSWFTGLADTIREHCLRRNYELCYGADQTGYTKWFIKVPGREGPVRLGYSVEVFLIDFPGGFGWTEFADPCKEDAQEAVQTLLQLLDVYADPGTRLVSMPRRWRRKPRRELHFADGTILWRRGGYRPPS